MIHKVEGIGKGTKPKRIFPTTALYLDPFIMLDHFSVEKPYGGFPTHPHRGFEIITYVLEGALEHKDSAGNEGLIQAGGIQRITAGSGIYHSEMPGTDGRNQGLQLWINMPRAQKGVDASYQDIKASEIVETTEDGVKIRTLVGEDAVAVMQRPMFYYDIEMLENKDYTATLPSGFQGFIYVLNGSGTVGPDQAEANEGDLLWFEISDKDQNVIFHSQNFFQFIFVAGEPIGEKPIFNGSYVD